MRGVENIEDNPVIKGLLDTVRSLQDQLSAQSDLQKILQQKDRQVERLQAQVALLQRLLYGSKSEKRRLTEMSEGQLSLFANDSVVAELIPTEVSPLPKQEAEESKPAKKKPVRVALPDNLPKEVITLKPDGDLSQAKYIGSEISSYLAYQPGRYTIKEINREKYVTTEGKILIAELPTRAIPKGNADETLLAHIVVSKYVDHLPFYRQTKIMARVGITLAESTMNGWLDAICKLLNPLYEHLQKRILESGYVQVDETGMPVQTTEKPGSTHKGYLWNFHAPLSYMVGFIYDKSRGVDLPQKILKNYKGVLQTDGYQVYNAISKESADIVHLGCMAHARRYFDRALDNDPDRANYALSLIGALYKIEKDAQLSDLSSEERYNLRQIKSVPILNRFKQWLDEESMQILPKSRIGEAFIYAKNSWDKLISYTLDGSYLIDNNLIENTIRPVALGRKNYMFAGSHQGAERAAMMYSFLGTCKLNNVDPQQWLTDVLQRIPDHSIQKLDELLPNYWIPLK